MEIICKEKNYIVCIKPAGVLSTDEPGGLPSLVRAELGDEKADVRTVHRLDRVVSGLMVLARNHETASELSRQIREDSFEKYYLAVCRGSCEDSGRFEDLMYRDKARKMSFVTDTPGKGVLEAVLEYETLGREEGMSLVRIKLITGRTHQIRCQFAAHGLPLVGERKYNVDESGLPLALWSHSIAFNDSEGKRAVFSAPPPDTYPWACFKIFKKFE